ncbi:MULTISPECIES: hypothetical protein [Clostridium]|nr:MULTISPECIES: hypothetical protein [Clostridium]
MINDDIVCTLLDEQIIRNCKGCPLKEVCESIERTFKQEKKAR